MLLRLRSQTCKSICNQFCILHVEVDILDKKKELKISVNFIYMVNGNTFVYNPFALHIEVNPMQQFVKDQCLLHAEVDTFHLC